jgi:hypothetical protein
MSRQKPNEMRLRKLYSMGAAWPELVDEISDLLESKDSPYHVAAFFQLPYPLYLDTDWHRVPGSRADKNIFVYFQPRLMRFTIDAQVHLNLDQSPDVGPDGTLITQMIALVPMWGVRLRFHPEYLKCWSGEDLAHRLVVPKQANWLQVEGAMFSSTYEQNLLERIHRAVRSGLRFLLPSYSISSLVEAPLPRVLTNFFFMPAPGRAIFNPPPSPIWTALLSRVPSDRVPTVSSGQLQTALKGGLRELGRFEHQLFAMNRLRLEGERALAFIGTMALLEWYLNLHFFKSKPEDKQLSLRKLIERGHLNFFPKALRTFFLKANALRNELIHGAPPNRYEITSAHDAAGREQQYQGNSIASEKVEEVISAALEAYRLGNLKRAGRLGDEGGLAASA